MIDVGCGEGHWGAEFERLGCPNVIGMDGSYVADPLIFVVNKEVWASWTPADQAIVRQAAIDAGKQEIVIARKGLIEADKPVFKDIAAMGVTVTQLTAEERAAFVKATRPVYDKWTNTVGVDLVRAAEKAVAERKK